MNLFLPSLSDLLDIGILTFFIYKILMTLNRKNAKQIILAFILLISLYFVSAIMQLNMMTSILSNIKNYWLILFIVLFQNEIRTFISKISIGENYFLDKRMQTELNNNIVNACLLMSLGRIGALIVIEHEQELNNIIRSGEVIDSTVSVTLLQSIFQTKSVLHDGAVIIRKDKIHAAKVILPHPEDSGLKKLHGTRHLAAIGISEKTDATAIVVSEETGNISFAKNGILYKNLEKGEIFDKLNE
jgi:diadenylate cyclase